MESIGFIQDGSLVRKAQGGDQAAFAQLVRTYDQAVLRLELRLTGSESDAQDIHQEAFLKVTRSVPISNLSCAGQVMHAHPGQIFRMSVLLSEKRHRKHWATPLA